MGKDKQNKDANGRKTSDNYKLVIYRSEDFQEVRSFDLSPGNIYVLTSITVLLICVAIFSLLAFTPLNRLIPGYGQLEVNPKFLQLVDGVGELEDRIEARETYLSGLRNMLSVSINQGAVGRPLAESGVSSNSRSTVTQDVLSRVGVEATDVEFATTGSTGEMHQLIQSFANQKVVYPVTGLVSSHFDPSIKHYGIDILAPSQSAILAMADGYVFSSGWDLETGYTLGIQHDDNILSFYKHNSRLLKEKGTFVRAGEAVAIIGNTGTMSNGPHLHFEIWHNGKPVNPKDILNFN